jgi:hypothetical protein
MTQESVFSERWSCPDCGLLIQRRPAASHPKLVGCKRREYLTPDVLRGERNAFEAMMACHEERPDS